MDRRVLYFKLTEKERKECVEYIVKNINNPPSKGTKDLFLQKCIAVYLILTADNTIRRFGKHHFSPTLQKLASKWKDCYSPPNSSKIVSMYSRCGDLIKTFNSVHDASKYIGSSTGHICAICKKKKTFFSSKGNYFSYGNVNKIKITQEAGDKHRKAINQFSKKGKFIKKWISGTKIHQKLGYNQALISMCCNKRKGHNSAYGFKWRFANES